MALAADYPNARRKLRGSPSPLRAKEKGFLVVFAERSDNPPPAPLPPGSVKPFKLHGTNSMNDFHEFNSPAKQSSVPVLPGPAAACNSFGQRITNSAHPFVASEPSANRSRDVGANVSCESSRVRENGQCLATTKSG